MILDKTEVARHGAGNSRLTAWDLTVSLLLIVGLSVFYAIRIHYVAGMPALGDCLLGTDTNIRIETLTQDPGRYLGWGLPRRHALSVIPTAIVAVPLIKAGVSVLDAVIAAIAVAQALGGALLLLFCRRQGNNLSFSLASTLLALLTFSVVTGSSAVDSYGITFTGACLAALLITEICGRSFGNVALRAALCGVAGGIAGWGIAPAAILSLLFCAFEPGELFSKRIIGGGILAALVAVLVTMSVPVALDVFHREPGVTNFLETWSSLSNIWTINYASYFARFFLFTVASPLDHVRVYYETIGVVTYLQRPQALLGVVLFYALLGWGMVEMVRRGCTKALVVIVGLILVLFLFHVFFDPQEVGMFAVEWMLLLVLPIMLGTGALPWRTIVVAVTLALLALSNIAPIYASAEKLKAADCPA